MAPDILDQETKERWLAWRLEFLVVVTAGGMPGVDPDDYWDYFEDGHTPLDAWLEDCSHAD